MVAALVVVPADPAGDGGRGDVEQLVAVLTEPDRGPAGATTRWTSQTLTYRLELDGYPLWYIAEVHAAFAWGAAVSGLHVAPHRWSRGCDRATRPRVGCAGGRNAPH